MAIADWRIVKVISSIALRIWAASGAAVIIFLILYFFFGGLLAIAMLIFAVTGENYDVFPIHLFNQRSL